MSTPLILKTPTSSSQHDNPIIKTHHHHNHQLSPLLLEAGSIARISLPMALTGLLLFSRSAISMLFLGRLGSLPLAGGSLALGFANITGYSVLSGLSLGMEPICVQAYGARRYKLLGLTLQRSMLMLIVSSTFISLLWTNMKPILILFGQDPDIAIEAQKYILFSLPDLFAQSILHPIRIYLRSQMITLPLTYCVALSVLIHVPINYLLVDVLGLGIKGVALGSVWTNINLVISLIVYIIVYRVYRKTWCNISLESFKGWESLLNLAIPSCISVCLEWWWYEIMILLCGLLLNPRATVASMGILIQTTSLLYILPSSLSSGVSTRVGNELGGGRPSRARLAAIVGLTWSFILGLMALLFAVSVRKIWATMFTADPEIITLTASVLPVIGLCELGNCPQTTGCGVLRGTARLKLGANINLGCFYMVGMPVAVWLGFYGGLDFKGLWLGLLAAQAACAVTMLTVLARTNWEHEAARAKELMTSSAPVPDFVDEDFEQNADETTSLKENDEANHDDVMEIP